MPKIIQLSSHVANLIAAGEVVERPASVVKELTENAVDAGATQVTVEIRDGGMTFIRVTDNGCGMASEDARTAFLRHATSKLRTADDLAAIHTMGFRGEALAAIASVSRIDLITKTADDAIGTSLSLEAGNITEQCEAGCPQGTTIIIRDLFFNTPARMKFMKSDSVEGSRVTAAVQLQALAHPEVSFRFLRDGKEILNTPGNGNLEATVYCVYGRESGAMVPVDSVWEQYHLTGFASKPSNARPSRSLQTFFVNGRPVHSKLLVAAFEEAYRNQLMVGKFPSCVLHLTLPANAVDVNVHPAKTEVKFLNEKAVFDCVHYGILGALNKSSDRPDVRFKASNNAPAAVQQPQTSAPKPQAKQENFFRTMTASEFKTFSTAVKDMPQPKPMAAAATAAAVERMVLPPLREERQTPAPYTPSVPAQQEIRNEAPSLPPLPEPASEVQQQELPMPETESWRMVGELYRSYIIVEQGDEAYLIDKHAAHERILFEKLKANQEAINSQTLLSPVSCRVSPAEATALLTNQPLLEELGFKIEEFGDNTVLIRQVPMDLSADSAGDALAALAADLTNGRRESKTTVRDEMLHTVACKAAIKAGWQTTEAELLALAKQVMEDESLKHCPHGRPICISLSKKHLEKEFKRS
ncbi:MAG: DNA mismatch repair endonuclease MutL [Oscillospiraceae bacterium]|nr:DNA mismatch repair endonuclease MutL [Oscillospiraceae bacterium]